MNRKGYMLVEIVLASAIAFIIAGFVINLIIKLKNKNDDSFVETLVSTDQAIAMNKLMNKLQNERDKFTCNVTINKIADNYVLKYNNETLLVFNDYVDFSNLSNNDFCRKKIGSVSITIPMKVPQMPNKNFDININYKYKINDIASPRIEVSDMTEDTVTGSTFSTYSSRVKISDVEGIRRGKYKLKYDWSVESITCKDMKYSMEFVIGDEVDEDIMEGEVTEKRLALKLEGITKQGILYVCNETPISDVNGNELPQSVVSAYGDVMYLDATPPTCSISITKNGNVNNATLSLIKNDEGTGIKKFGLYNESLNIDASTFEGNSIETVDIINPDSFNESEPLKYYGYVVDKANNYGICEITLYAYDTATKKCLNGTKIAKDSKKQAINFCLG